MGLASTTNRTKPKRLTVERTDDNVLILANTMPEIGSNKHIFQGTKVGVILGQMIIFFFRIKGQKQMSKIIWTPFDTNQPQMKLVCLTVTC